MEIKTDRQKRQVSYRQIKLDEKSCRAGDDAVLPRSGCRVETAGFTNIEEYWQLSEFGELVIQRQVRHEGQPVLQYLVLERATGLVD